MWNGFWQNLTRMSQLSYTHLRGAPRKSMALSGKFPQHVCSQRVHTCVALKRSKTIMLSRNIFDGLHHLNMETVHSVLLTQQLGSVCVHLASFRILTICLQTLGWLRLKQMLLAAGLQTSIWFSLSLNGARWHSQVHAPGQVLNLNTSKIELQR